MKKTLIELKSVRARGYKVLLYADNRQHMRILSRIRRDPDLSGSYVGCWHITRDASGAEIVTGENKKHCHIILSFDNPRYWNSVCKQLGFVKDDGSADTQFCRAIGYNQEQKKIRETIERGYVYLIHANVTDKEQYSVADLFGAPDKVEAARAAVVAYQMRSVTLSDSLRAIRDWVNSQFDVVITPNKFVSWLITTPYVRSAHNPWVRQMIEAHNAHIYSLRNRQYLGEVSNGLQGLANIQNDDFFDEWDGDLPGVCV